MSEDLLDPSFNSGNSAQIALPNASAVLVLGIISIATCWLYAIPGIVCGIIAIVLHKRDKELYLSNPKQYEQSFKTSKSGNICGIIGLSLSCAFIVFLIIYFVFIFAAIGVASHGAFR